MAAIEYLWSAVGRMTGKYRKQEEDVVAIAVGQAIPGKDRRDIVSDHKSGTQLEAYYSSKVNDQLALIPDMQIIWGPNGEE